MRYRQLAPSPDLSSIVECYCEFPKRVLYWREGELLHARIEGVRKGKPASKEWIWKRR